jgi:hypothetical protein
MILDELRAASIAKKIVLDLYHLGVEWNTLGASATTTQNVVIDADSDFLAVKVMLASYSAAGTIVTNPDYTLTISDSGSGRLLQNQPIHINTICGTAQLPYVLPEPKLFKASSTVSLTLTNRTTTAARVNLTLGGVKIYYMPGFSRSSFGW